MFRRYKEIFYGLGLGLAMWVVDAAMHAQLGAEVQSHGLAAELLRPGATQLFFRVVFVAISTALGWALWRSNWRERELRALEDAVVAFHRQLDGSAVRIMSYARMLQSRPGLEHDEVARAVVADLGDDARAIDELTRQYVRFRARDGRAHPRGGRDVGRHPGVGRRAPARGCDRAAGRGDAAGRLGACDERSQKRRNRGRAGRPRRGR